MLGARRCLRFRVILFVSTLTMWAMARSVLTVLCRRAVTVAI